MLTKTLEEYADIRDRMIPLFLLPYSPDFKQMRRITRREVTHNVNFLDATTLVTTLDEYFAGLKDLHEKLSPHCTFKYRS